MQLCAKILAGIMASALLLAGGALVLLKQTDALALSVQSGSMTPAIRKGDLVVVKRVPHYQVGDVITFMSPLNRDITITHRVISVDEARRTVQTKGDANRTEDKTISTGLIIGKVHASMPHLGHGIDFVRQPAGLLLVIYAPALLVIGAEMRRLTAHYRTSRPYRMRGYPSLRQQMKHTPQRQWPVAAKALGVALITLPLAAMPVHAALSGNSVTLQGNTITSAIVRYSVCNFPAHESLLSYAPEDAFYPKVVPGVPLTLDQPIQPGTYRVTATYTDNHAANPNEPSQPNERWFAQLYADGSIAPSYTTGVTDDLLDTIDEASTVINDSLTVTQPVTGIRYVHNAANTGYESDQFGGRRFDDLTYQEKRQVLWNSIHPKCVTFEKITAVPATRLE